MMIDHIPGKDGHKRLRNRASRADQSCRSAGILHRYRALAHHSPRHCIIHMEKNEDRDKQDCHNHDAGMLCRHHKHHALACEHYDKSQQHQARCAEFICQISAHNVAADGAKLTEDAEHRSERDAGSKDIRHIWNIVIN